MQNDSERLICKKAENAALAALKSDRVYTMPYMNEREQELCVSALNKLKCNTYVFYGGFDNAIRKMLAVGKKTPDVSEFDCIVLAIEAKFSANKLTHRDYLGSIMSLNITRDFIGDIIVNENGAIVFTNSKFAHIICDELTQVKNTNVNVKIAEDNDMSQILNVINPCEKTVTIASLRLDAIIAAMLKISRGKAVDLAKSKAIMVNHIVVDSPGFEIQEGDVFTIKGKGKFKLQNVGNKSKKDRIFVSYLEY